MLGQLDQSDSLFGIPKALFFRPEPGGFFHSKRFGHFLETPIGVAAGPHTQLAQNIVAAWLTGARFIELKTIQTLDELEISKPCIDMQDEGYNCEWSQELKIEDSFDQYLNAWIIIHILKDKYKWGDKNEPGVIFNMSVGYDLAGILKENVQWFFKSMADASTALQQKIESIRDVYPNVVNLDINSRISDNITLSTMHGCPPDEIEKIGVYLLKEKKLHTAIKLNPTLLGKEELHSILKNSGFETEVPDIAFEHDLKYADAVNMIRSLQKTAAENDLQFGLKLSNTLESLNHKEIFPSGEEMMYMSGRALHPISVNLAAKLQNDFHGALDISFSAGVDAFNLTDVIASGLYPATVCTDLLKPGGYGRLHQYIEELRAAFSKSGADSIDNLIIRKSKPEDANVGMCSLNNLNNYAVRTLKDDRYKKTNTHEPSIKTNRALNYFDCIHAPCIDACPTHQDVPAYMYHCAQGNFDKAAGVILETNPFPNMTGMVCDHLCQTKCTRINYDSPVLIREIKRFIAENSEWPGKELSKPNKALKAGIIGAGPSGLSCAYFLALAGLEVNVYETKPKPGGMVSGAIPSFRLTHEAIDIDIERITGLGVRIHYNQTIDKTAFKRLREDHDCIYIGTGAQKAATLNINGIEAQGVFDPLQFLFDVKDGKPSGIGQQLAIIGGGNTAMDTARVANRLVGERGKVTIIYRRKIKQMPADTGEIKAVMEEGIEILELTAPRRINVKDRKLVSLSCHRMKLGEKDESGRARPVEIPGTEFEVEIDTLIPAIGQDLAIDFISTGLLKTEPGNYETRLPGVFVGGDALRGASTTIHAIADGRKAAREIIMKAGIDIPHIQKDIREPLSLENHMADRASRVFPVKVNETALSDRKSFKLISATLSKEEAIKEASRCLLCDEVCNICTTTCPNLALYSYEIEPVTYNLQKIIKTGEGYQVVGDKTFEVDQKLQILHIADWCNDCGNCTTFCPSSGSPYKDKPHLHLSRKSFDSSNDGYFLERSGGDIILSGKKNGRLTSLARGPEYFIYVQGRCRIEIEKETFRIIDYAISEAENPEIQIQEAAEMSIILLGALHFLK